MNNYSSTVEQRFVKYAQIDTTADPKSSSFASLKIQTDLASDLVMEVLEWDYVSAAILDNTTNAALLKKSTPASYNFSKYASYEKWNLASLAYISPCFSPTFQLRCSIYP